MRPSNITYRKRSKALVLDFAGDQMELSAELLRVYSPSAEVRGHAPEQKRLQTGKKHVAVTAIEPVGNYGIRLSFDDGHDTGIYAWGLPQGSGRSSGTLLAGLSGGTESRQCLAAARDTGGPFHAQENLSRAPDPPSAAIGLQAE